MADFDETHALNQRAVPYDVYFGEMSLTKEQKEERKKLAEEIEDALLFLFALIEVYREYTKNSEYGLAAYIEIIIMQFKNRYSSVLQQNDRLDEYLNEYLDLYAAEVVETTVKHIDEEYYTSQDRAMYNAENEANSVKNYTDYRKAIEKGKTKKKWIDMRDKRERKTHLEVGGTVIPINEPFVVGNSLMMFPKDDSLGADDKEIIGCRCSCKYF
jgi:hypothetical protein